MVGEGGLKLLVRGYVRVDWRHGKRGGRRWGGGGHLVDRGVEGGVGKVGRVWRVVRVVGGHVRLVAHGMGGRGGRGGRGGGVVHVGVAGNGSEVRGGGEVGVVHVKVGCWGRLREVGRGGIWKLWVLMGACWIHGAMGGATGTVGGGGGGGLRRGSSGCAGAGGGGSEEE